MMRMLRLLWLTFTHKDTPLPAKLLLIGGVLYGMFPMDVIPDMLPLLGIADDATVILIAVLGFLGLSKRIRKTLAASD